jgi:hypothetical protein
MDVTTIVVLAALVLIALLAVKWAQYVFGAVGLALIGAGGMTLARQKEWGDWLQGGDLRGLAPQLPMIGYVAIGLGLRSASG